MTKLTRAQVDGLIKPGDVILVHYLKKDIVAVGIQFFSEGQASHAICSLGGLDAVEADAGGVMHSNLDTYLRGHCRLTIKRLHPAPTQDELKAMKSYWLARVGDPYDFGMILGMVPIFIARRFLHHFSASLARAVVRNWPNLFGKHNLNTCAELWVRGVRASKRRVLDQYDPENVAPEILMRDAKLEMVAVYEAPILVQGDR